MKQTFCMKKKTLKAKLALAAAAGLLGALTTSLGACGGGNLFDPLIIGALNGDQMLQVEPIRLTYEQGDFYYKKTDVSVYLQTPGDIDMKDVSIMVDGAPLEVDDTLTLNFLGVRPVVLFYQDLSAKYYITVKESTGGSGGGGGITIIINE